MFVNAAQTTRIFEASLPLLYNQLKRVYWIAPLDEKSRQFEEYKLLN